MRDLDWSQHRCQVCWVHLESSYNNMNLILIYRLEMERTKVRLESSLRPLACALLKIHKCKEASIDATTVAHTKLFK